MILDFEWSKGNLIVSEINPEGNIVIKHYPWKNPRKFTVCDENDPDRHKRFTTWNKKPVKLAPTNRPNRFAIYEYIDALPVEERDRLFAMQYPKLYFMDIETEILPSGFVEPKNANSKVLTVAIVHEENVYVLGLKELPSQSVEKIKDDIEEYLKDYNIKVNFKYMSFHNRENPEKEMLKYLFDVLIPKMPVITGWNFLGYDWTFLINRCRRLGIKPESASLTKKLETIYMTDFEVPAHRLVVDYMEIWKKAWNTFVKVKESNSLNWVSNHLFKLKKIHYDGNLQDLYRDDFAKYVLYNAVDTILVQMIHEKTKLLDIIFSVANLSKIRLCDFAYKNLNTTLVSTEGLLRGEFRDKKNIILCKDYEDDGDLKDEKGIEGGFVKEPVRGLQELIATFDFASLYPTLQRQFRIAPENFKGYRLKDDPKFAQFDGVINEINDDDVVCINGAVFSKDYSVTTTFLEDVYKQRKKYKNIMQDKLNEVKDLATEIKELEDELKNM